MVEEIRKIFDILNECNFDELCEDNYRDQVIDPIKATYGWNFCYNIGASKLVLQFPFYPNMIKIPFVNERSYYDEDLEEYIYSPLDGVEGGNYLKEEVEIYNCAVQDGVEELFAEVKFLGFVDNHPVYEQAECVVYEDLGYEDIKHYSSENSRTRAKEIWDATDDYIPFEQDWIASVIESYGEKMYDKLMHFIDDNYIEDLHLGNYGFIGGKPVIFDYGSYRG